MTEAIYAEHLIERLRLRFAAPQYIFCEEFEVPILNREIGGKFARRIDAMAHGLNPCRPYLIGFEVKVARSDWLAELKQPEKAERFRPHCNEWYVVSPLKGVVKKEELPEGWGWMATHGERLAIKRRSVWNDAPNYCPAIMAGFLRKAYLGSIKQQDTQRSEGWKSGYEYGLEEALTENAAQHQRDTRKARKADAS